MPNIFDGLNKMDEEMYRYLIATLEMVTLTNITTEMGQNTKRGSVKAVNKLMKIMKKESLETPEVLTMEERIRRCNSELLNVKRDVLDERIKMLLIRKLETAGTKLEHSPSDDEISVAVINEASKAFKKEIDDIFSPAEKADAIKFRYNSRITAQLEKNLKSQSETEKTATERAIEDKLKNMTEEQKRELRKALKLKELSGESVRKMMTTATGTAAVMAALQVSGFGAYIAVTTIMHAIFTTTLGLTLPFAAYTGATSFLAFLTGPFGWMAFIGTEILMITNSRKKLVYELLAQVVWSSVVAYGEDFVTSKEHLPSWLVGEEKVKAIKESDEIIKLTIENEALRNDVRENETSIIRLKSNIDKIQQDKDQLQHQLENMHRELNQQRIMKEKLDREIADLEVKNNELEQDLNNIPQIERENYENKLKELEDLKIKYEEKSAHIKKLSETILKNESHMGDYEKQIENKENEKNETAHRYQKMEEELNDIRKKLADMEKKAWLSIDKNASKLASRWETVYSRMNFRKSVFKYVVKNYRYEDLAPIEVRLMEMHGTEDPASLSGNRGKMKNDGRLHIEADTVDVPSRIFYTVESKREKYINIEEIVKHNDSRYGK